MTETCEELLVARSDTASLTAQTASMVIGIDVAADRLNCVALGADGTLVAGRIYASHELAR